MADSGWLENVLAGSHVDTAVFTLRPDYRACWSLWTGSPRARVTHQ
jgi:hypothetical protein